MLSACFFFLVLVLESFSLLFWNTLVVFGLGHSLLTPGLSGSGEETPLECGVRAERIPSISLHKYIFLVSEKVYTLEK